MVLNQNNDFQAQISIPLALKNMTKQMRDLTLEAVVELCDKAKFCNENHNKLGYEHLPYYGNFQYLSASLVIIAENDGSKTFFLDIDVYFESDSLHKSYGLENLSEELIDRYCGLAFMNVVKGFAENLSRCKYEISK